MAVSRLRPRARGRASPTLYTSAMQRYRVSGDSAYLPSGELYSVGEERRNRCVRESITCNLTRERARLFMTNKRSMPDERFGAFEPNLNLFERERKEDENPHVPS